jgi:acetoin utilization deacetylase AcuC-like enzyme
MLGGGGNHAYPDHGGALSSVNDVAIGVHHLRRRGIRRVLVLDLDAHFGNGTAAFFPNDPDLFLFDFHGHASDFGHPDTPLMSSGPNGVSMDPIRCVPARPSDHGIAIVAGSRLSRSAVKVESK